MKKSGKDFSSMRERADTDLLIHRELAGTPEEWWHFRVHTEIHSGGQSQPYSSLDLGFCFFFF